MKDTNKLSCLLQIEKNTQDNITHFLANDFNIIHTTNLENIRSLIQFKSVDCIIIRINDNKYGIEKYLYDFKNPGLIPLIGIIKKNDIDTARWLGNIGFSKVVCEDNLFNLADEIEDTIKSSLVKVKLADFNINIENYPELVAKALQIIEDKYLTLLSVQEISNMLTISDCYLPKEFKKCSLWGPKRIIMYFKIRHALNLFKFSDFNLNEISHLSGFTNAQRFIECYNRVFSVPIKKCRTLLKNQSIMTFWNQYKKQN